VFGGDASLTFNKATSILLVNTAAGSADLGPATLIIANSTADIFTVNTSTYAPTGNGYTTLPGNIILQWGTVLSNTTSGNVTFATNTGKAFTTAIFSATANANTAGATGSGNFCSVIQANTTQISVRTANATAKTVYWMAIGR
jgi:hypothetical protein